MNPIEKSRWLYLKRLFRKQYRYPLVFIRTPMLMASRQGTPQRRAADAQPVIFPQQAVRMTINSHNHVVPSFSNPILVLSPDDAKNCKNSKFIEFLNQIKIIYIKY